MVKYFNFGELYILFYLGSSLAQSHLVDRPRKFYESTTSNEVSPSEESTKTSSLEEELHHAQRRVTELEKELSTVKSQSKHTEMKLAEMLLNKATPSEEICKILSPLFSPEQITSLMSNHSHIKQYSEEAITNAITLHSLSMKAYFIYYYYHFKLVLLYLLNLLNPYSWN